MNRPPASVAAFTLIEMMIAVALGSLVVYTAMAGFRAASQTVTAANRLSLENSLLRAGYWEAQTQLDFWTNLDDPSPTGSKPLRGSAGLPFAEFTSWTKGGGNPRGSTNGALNATRVRDYSELNDNTWEQDTGWDPTFSWSVHDPRTWTRANLAEKDRNTGNVNTDTIPPIWFGRYAIFAHTTPGANLSTFNVRPDYDNAPTATAVPLSYTGYGTSGVHPWYYRQLAGLIKAMGYAAFCEYLPPNALYTWYSDEPGSQLTAGSIDKLGIQPNLGFCNGDGWQLNSRGIYRQTYSTSYGYMNPRAPGVSITGDHNRRFNTDYGANSGGGADELRTFLAKISFPEKIMGQKPDHWPTVEVSVGRLIKNAHHVAIAKIRRVSSLTGESIELSWSGLGSTLRGARQQRKPGSGWANWDNSGATNDPNLDTQ